MHDKGNIIYTIRWCILLELMKDNVTCNICYLLHELQLYNVTLLQIFHSVIFFPIKFDRFLIALKYWKKSPNLNNKRKLCTRYNAVCLDWLLSGLLDAPGFRDNQSFVLLANFTWRGILVDNVLNVINKGKISYRHCDLQQKKEKKTTWKPVSINTNYGILRVNISI